jgi:hypothetical protein
MKRGTYLVNTARAKICNRDAVVRALESGQLAGYAGDVWFPQPAPKDHREAEYCYSRRPDANLEVIPATGVDAVQVVNSRCCIKMRRAAVAHLFVEKAMKKQLSPRKTCCRSIRGRRISLPIHYPFYHRLREADPPKACQ